MIHGELLARGEFLHVEHWGAELLPSELLVWTFLNPVAGLASVVAVLVFFDRVAAYLRTSANGDESGTTGGRRDLAKAVFLVAALSFHVGLSTSFVTFHNNYFLPFLPLAALLAAQALRESFPPPRVVDLALLGVAILVGTLAIERHFRFVEAAELARQALIRAGVPSLEVFSHPSAYAASHNDFVVRDLERHRDEGPAAFAVFHRIRSSAAFWIGNPSLVADPRGWRRVDELRYPDAIRIRNGDRLAAAGCDGSGSLSRARRTPRVATSRSCSQATTRTRTEPPTPMRLEMPRTSRYRPWAEPLRGTVGIDVETCPRCDWPACACLTLVTELKNVARLLRHLGEPAEPSRRPPGTRSPFWQLHPAPTTHEHSVRLGSCCCSRHTERPQQGAGAGGLIA